MPPRSIGVFVSCASCLLLLMSVLGCEREPEPAAQPPPPESATAPPAGQKPTIDDPTLAKAQKLIDRVTQQIKDGEFAAAEITLHELEPMSARLPESMQRQVEAAQASLEAARSARGAPGSPGQ